MKTGVLGSKYTWLVGPSWNRLHYIPGIDDDLAGRSGLAFWDTFYDGWIDGNPPERDLPAACGKKLQWQLPGIISRIGLPRCYFCCRKLGIPPGAGAPTNDKKITENEPFVQAVKAAGC